MEELFPEPVLRLLEADIPVPGAAAYLSEGKKHQILFMRFSLDADLPEHTHAGQWGVVLEGRLELTVGGERRIYEKGDRYYIPQGVKHSAKIYAGYADITFFDQPDRYPVKSHACDG